MDEKGKQVRILMGRVVKKEADEIIEEDSSSDDDGSTGGYDDKISYVEYDDADLLQGNKKLKVVAKPPTYATGGGGHGTSGGGSTTVSVRRGYVGGGGTGGGGGYGNGGGTLMKCCQAEKCTADLTDSKPYHKRHRVCEHHAKAQVVLVAGKRQRFCQQCSRFHELSEFDETKRSCRRRLAGHNERRRKNAAGESQGAGGDRSGRSKGSRLKEMVCGQIDDRGRIKITIQENATFKHFEIR